MQFLNTNTIHNILNILNLALAGATAALIASGCAALPTGTLDCSQSFISPAYTALAIAAVNVIKLGINVARDGLGGLVKQQPPVK